ncbi:uncharacterized protein LOC125767432 [Anopheles funestus]|uniref:Uncharacterized protein n=1 Tax=Anopheles funestus TaxID=62324 RepID=A0A182S2S0_ANOFN|nr:uncharacterized protein LOC125767432 [Anopheles funestus]XP_049289988.1 uncharacterized protein LOC125767432 [Anopheles funestus]XP_049289996.1 uncharacterized protein LOC125767432 [Anopheles funestus]
MEPNGGKDQNNGKGEQPPNEFLQTLVAFLIAKNRAEAEHNRAVLTTVRDQLDRFLRRASNAITGFTYPPGSDAAAPEQETNQEPEAEVKTNEDDPVASTGGRRDSADSMDLTDMKSEVYDLSGIFMERSENNSDKSDDH